MLRYISTDGQWLNATGGDIAGREYPGAAVHGRTRLLPQRRVRRGDRGLRLRRALDRSNLQRDRLAP